MNLIFEQVGQMHNYDLYTHVHSLFIQITMCLDYSFNIIM